jgi:hypothetical protein
MSSSTSRFPSILTRACLRKWVTGGLTVTKIGELLARERPGVPYRTLHRFAVECCGFTGGRAG